MKNIKLFFFLFVFSSCTIAQSYARPATKKSNGPQISLTGGGSSFDLGTVVINSSNIFRFEFKNSGTEDLVITNTYSAAVGTYNPKATVNVSGPDKPIKPGKKGIITVTFVSQDDIGSFRDDIHIVSNASPNDQSLFQVSGAVVPLSNVRVEPNDPGGQIIIYKGPIWNNRK